MRVMKRNLGEFSIEPVVAGPVGNGSPEWGRWQDVHRLYAIKRGIAYMLLAEGKIKAVSLRRRGHLRGCRLFYLPSIAAYLENLLNGDQGK